MSAGEGFAKGWRGISPESILVPVNIDPLFRGVKKKKREEGEGGIIMIPFRDLEKFADSFWFGVKRAV